jgi:hypothetical protein
MYIFFVSGTDQTFAKFYFSFLKLDNFGISSGGASWGTILYWFSFSVNIFHFVILYLCKYLDWSFDLCYSDRICSSSYMSNCRLLWRFTSCCNLDNLCLGSWSYCDKSFCSWFFNWIYYCTAFSIIICLDYSKTECHSTTSCHASLCVWFRITDITKDCR